MANDLHGRFNDVMTADFGGFSFFDGHYKFCALSDASQRPGKIHQHPDRVMRSGGGTNGRHRKVHGILLVFRNNSYLP